MVDVLADVDGGGKMVMVMVMVMVLGRVKV